ncbi:DUF6624 domain-containing protein [Mucilaginibacter angelicae]|uniref:DUF6624 domain-containing protein n=1 Tax=Mucilaginibacter angelicae TaxID=869718 RepID=A0ABV6L4S3_9SPHI
MYSPKFLSLCICFSVFAGATFCQTGYRAQLKQAEDIYHNGRYTKAALTYRVAFAAYPDSIKAMDIYRSARAWALAGKTDSAIIQLKTAVQVYKFNKYGMLMADGDFVGLPQHKDWEILTIETNKNMRAAYTPLQRELQQIKDDDQRYRRQDIVKTKDTISAEFKKLGRQMFLADSINLVKVRNILDTRGWPSYSEIGDLYAALFLVIQHADLNTQVKYLPMIREAQKKNDIDPESVAILEDRVAVRQGRKQLYGSQLEYDPKSHTYIVSPIEDEAHVNERRAKVGMIPLQEYLKQMGLNYSPVK